MTPQEKAIELVDKFYLIEESQECDAWIDGYLAKKCALIAVDEILNSFGLTINERIFFAEYRAIDFYEEVKEEINKL
jgi:hypothetical protein